MICILLTISFLTRSNWHLEFANCIVLAKFIPLFLFSFVFLGFSIFSFVCLCIKM